MRELHRITAHLQPQYASLLSLEAKHRGMEIDIFVSTLLSFIARDQLVNAVLDDETLEEIALGHKQNSKKPLSKLQSHILADLQSHCDPLTGEIVITKREWAKQLQVSRQGIWAAILRLSELGFLDIMDDGFGTGVIKLQVQMEETASEPHLLDHYCQRSAV